MVNDNKNYILYGAASIGNIAKKTLESMGLKVIGYIDQRAYELPIYNGLPVWGLDQIPSVYINSETVVFISVKNVFEHEKIAETLYRIGFRYIIYKPYDVLLGYGSEQENIINEMYDNMFSGNLHFQVDLPAYQIREERELRDFGIICDDNGSVVVNIPAELIYTNDYQNTEMEKWGNLCILAFFTHINFFRFLSGDILADPRDYLQEYCVFTAQLQKVIEVTDAWKSNVINNRIQIYEQMKAAMDLDPNFFVRNAAEAVWNERKGYFNLISGKHRAAFQAAMGKKYLPLRITKEDYEKFLNISEVRNVVRLLYNSTQEITIPHPFFYRGIQIRDKGEYNFFSWFARFYARKIFFGKGKADFAELKILDYTNDFGNFSRFCLRMGCKVRRVCDLHPLEKQLNILFKVSTIEYIDHIVENTGNIVVVEESKLDEVMTLLPIENNTWIVCNARQNVIQEIALKNHLCVIEEISKSYQIDGIVQSCLMEKMMDEPMRK